MNLKEFIKKTGTVPERATMEDGTQVELFIRKKFSGGYIACLWTIENELPKVMLYHGQGETTDNARNELGRNILNNRKLIQD